MIHDAAAKMVVGLASHRSVQLKEDWLHARPLPTKSPSLNNQLLRSATFGRGSSDEITEDELGAVRYPRYPKGR